MTILYRLEGEPVVDYAMDFTDVAGDAYYAEAVRWAASEGIVGGYGGGLFGADDAVTREQLAVILYRYAVYKGYDVSIGEDTNILSYDDFADLSEYAIPAMQWACGAGVITGVTDATLVPQGEATRAQVAAMLMRFLRGDRLKVKAPRKIRGALCANSWAVYQIAIFEVRKQGVEGPKASNARSAGDVPPRSVCLLGSHPKP